MTDSKLEGALGRVICAHACQQVDAVNHIKLVKRKRLLAAAIVSALGLSVSQVSIAADAYDIDINSNPTNFINDDSAGNFSSSAEDANLNIDDITADWSSNFAVTVTTTENIGTLELGTISIDAALDFNTYGSSSLTLSAHDAININANISDSDGVTADSLILNLVPTGAVTLNAIIGEATNTTVSGDLIIDTGTYNLINAADSLSADTITKNTGGTFNYSAGSLTLNSGLTIDNTGLLGGTVVLGSTQNLQTTTQAIGTTGSLTQNGGSNTVLNALTVNSAGNYTLNDGSLDADSITADGTVTQTDGTVTVSNTINISDTGEYDLSGGSLTADDITRSTDGVFTYTGGDLTLNSGTLAIQTDGLLGNNVSIGSAQNLHTASQSIGSGGTLTQTGGSNTVDAALTVNAGGTYVLGGGSLSSNSLSTDGTFTQSGGSNTVNGALTVQTSGSYALSGDGALVSDSLVTDGTFTQSGGSNTVNGALTVQTAGSYALSGDGTLVSDSLTADSTFTQSGGSNTVNGTLTLQASGSYSLSGGSLTADVLDDSAGGSFSWTNGDLTLNNDDLTVDNTVGTLLGPSLTLTGTKNLRTVNQTVGTAVVGSGSITQELGSNNVVDGALTINAGGSYGSTSGSLTAGSVNVDGGFAQNKSATTDITGALTLNADSTFDLNGGTLAAGSIVNSGTMTQTLGNSTVNGALMIGNTGSYNHTRGGNTVTGALNINAGGSYGLSGGSLSAGSLDNSGTVTQTAGSNAVANALTINSGGSYDLSGGSLSAGSIINNDTLTTAGNISADDMTVGAGSSVSQTGGTTSIANTLSIDGTGSYSLGAGRLSAGSIDNSGAMVQSGAIADTYVTTLTMNAGSSYNLSGNFKNSGIASLSTTTINNSGAITQTGARVSSSTMTVSNGGSHDQSAGYNSVTDALTVNAGGTYNLSGSDNYSDNNYSHLSANSTDISGMMTQTGGYNNVNTTLTVASGGSYSMSGGTLAAGNIVRNGTFTYSGGELRLTASDLVVDSGGLLGSTVNIAGGQSFQAVNQIINNGGSISQTGGYNTANNILTINSGGSYALNGGTLQASSVVNNGAFNYTAGSVLLTNSDLAVDSAGLLGANLNITGGEAFDANNQTVGTGAALSGSINQSGGDNNVDNVLTINAGGSYTMSGGSLVAGQVINNGAFNYTAGAVRLTNSDLAIDSTGLLGDAINIIGGQSFGSVNQVVGMAAAASGSVNQSGGSNTVDNVLTINTGGSYTMSGGSLVAGSVINNGAFNYTGGAVRLTNDDLFVDNTGLLGATVNIGSGQVFGAVNQTVGTGAAGSGSITQTGGRNLIDNALIINAGGSYNLSGSTGYSYNNLQATSVELNGAMNQSGARSSMGSVLINNGGSYAQTAGDNYINGLLTINTGGSYDLNGGNLSVNDVVANGAFNFNSGSLSLSSGLTVGAGGILGGSVSINSGKSLGVGGGIIIDSGSILALDGGTLSTSAINDNGSFAFNSGLLRINNLTIGSGELLGGNVGLSSSRRLDVGGTVTVNNGATLTVSGSGSEFAGLTNSGDVSVSGGSLSVDNNVTNSNTVTISNGASITWVNAYTQTDGTTTVDGSLSATTVSIQGGLLTGSGTVSGNLVVSGNGTVNPGNSPGDLEIASKLTLNAGGTLSLEVGDDPANPGDYLWDQLIAGSFDLTAGRVDFSLLDSVDIDVFTSGFSIDDFFRVGSRSENFGYLEYGLDAALLENLTYRAYDVSANEWSRLVLGDNGTFSSVAAVPVPAAVWLFGSGLMVLIAAARRKTR